MHATRVYLALVHHHDEPDLAVGSVCRRSPAQGPGKRPAGGLVETQDADERLVRAFPICGEVVVGLVVARDDPLAPARSATAGRKVACSPTRQIAPNENSLVDSERSEVFLFES